MWSVPGQMSLAEIVLISVFLRKECVVSSTNLVKVIERLTSLNGDMVSVFEI